MQVMLAENIRAFRREKKLTQEQLAEVLGVTVGTVSKWESAASTPDVGLIMEMADFFGTSVDLLLGYRQQSASLADTLAHLRALRHDRRYAEGRREAEKAVRRFPNSFDVVYQSAMLWQMAGLEEQDKAASRRAEALYGRALELFDQNTDPTISRVSLNNCLANALLELDETERGIELLKQNNVEGANNARIGQVLAQLEGRGDEALDYFEEALLDSIAQLIEICVGYLNAEAGGGCAAGPARALTQLVAGFLAGLRRPGGASPMDKYLPALWCGCAILSEEQGLPEQAAADLRTAWQLAKVYDAAPTTRMDAIRFVRPGKLQQAAAFDDFGLTARAGVDTMLQKNGTEHPRLAALWKEFTDEEEHETDKA